MKIFFLTPRVPYPIDKGDKLRAFYQIRALSKTHDVFLFALDENCRYDSKRNPLNALCRNVHIVKLSKGDIVKNLVGGLFKQIPFQASYYYSREIKREIEKVLKDIQPDIIFCQMIRTAELVRSVTSIPKIMDFVDVISKGLERRIEKSNLFWKLALRLEYKRALEYEKKVFHDFNACIIITEEDRRFLPFEGRNRVKIIPNGIDTSIFAPQDGPKEYDLFFSGNLSYPPNIDAAEYIVGRILPLLKERMPNIKVLIAGASPTKAVKDMESENVTIKGWIDDIREYYKKARIFIAPMQIGTGLQNKLLQAMAMKLPCVISELAGKGLSNGGKNSIMVAYTPQDYVSQIIDLLKNEEYAKKLSEAGYHYVRTYHDWNVIIADLESILFSVVHQ